MSLLRGNWKLLTWFFSIFVITPTLYLTGQYLAVKNLSVQAAELDQRISNVRSEAKSDVALLHKQFIEEMQLIQSQNIKNERTLGRIEGMLRNDNR